MSDVSSTSINFDAILGGTGPVFICTRGVVRAGGSDETLVPGCVLQADSNAHNLEPWGGSNPVLGVLLEPITAGTTAVAARVLMRGSVKPDHIHVYNATANTELTATQWNTMKAYGFPSTSFQYRPVGVISGTLKDELTTPLTGITITLKDSDGNTVDTTTTALVTGAYSFSNVTVGSYTLNVAATDDYLALSTASVVTENTTTTTNLVQYWAVGDIAGVLQDEDETKRAGIVVTLKDAEGTVIDTVETTAVTGAFEFTDIPIGTYTLNVPATATYYATVDQEVIVLGGLEADGDIKSLFKVGSITGVCTDDAEPAVKLEGVSLTCMLVGSEGDPEYGPVLSDADGVYTFEDVRVGTAWKIIAVLAEHDTETVTDITVATDTATELDIVLDVTT